MSVWGRNQFYLKSLIRTLLIKDKQGFEKGEILYYRWVILVEFHPPSWMFYWWDFYFPSGQNYHQYKLQVEVIYLNSSTYGWQSVLSTLIFISSYYWSFYCHCFTLIIVFSGVRLIWQQSTITNQHKDWHNRPLDFYGKNSNTSLLSEVYTDDDVI